MHGNYVVKYAILDHNQFFVDVTSGDKIGEGRIRDLTGDVLFLVTCKRTIPTTIPTVTMINPGALPVHHV